MTATQQKPPKVSVLMSVHNDAATVEAAVYSILAQSFGDFEFIIVNDGSTDGTARILRRLASQDARIRVVDQDNTGLTRALNLALSAARGVYAARQDGDDLSHRERLARQVAILDTRPEVVLVGSNSEDRYENGQTGTWGWWDEDRLQRTVFAKTPFPHSSVMMRTELARRLGGYDASYRTAQDMELWMRFAKHGRLVMTPEPLITRAVRRNAISGRRFWRQAADAARARLRHAPGGAVAALYQSARQIAISLLPWRWALALRKRVSGTNVRATGAAGPRSRPGGRPRAGSGQRAAGDGG